MITPLTHTKKGKKRIAVKNALQFKIGDNLSGISQYCGYINDVWVLMEYNAWRNILTYKFDDALKPGKNTFELRVVDKMGNTSTYSREVIR